MTSYSQRLALYLLASFAAVAAVLFTPAFPLLVGDLHLSSDETQWILTIYLLGYSLGMLPYGPIANRWGRKNAIDLGLVLAFLGAAIVYFSQSYTWVCVGRLLQAFGAAVGLKISLTMLSDLHQDRKEAHSMIGWLSTSLPILTGVGIVVGGSIVDWFGWRGSFLVLMIYTLILYLLARTLPETAHRLDPEALHWKKIAQKLGRQFCDSFLVLHAFVIGLGTAVFYIFYLEAPFVAIDLMGISPKMYSWYSLIPLLGFLCGQMISARIGHKTRPRIAMLSAIILMIVSLLAMSLFFAIGFFNPWALFVPVALIFIGTAVNWVFGTSTVLSEAKDKSNASATLQCINVGTAAFGTFVAGASFPVVPFSISIAFAWAIALMLVLWLGLRAHHERRGH